MKHFVSISNQFIKIQDSVYMLTIFISLTSIVFYTAYASNCGILDSNAYGISSGLMKLLPDDLNSGVTSKNFYQSFSQANFPTYGLVSNAFSITGFSGAGKQQYYSLSILIVEIQNSNTRFRMVLDFKKPNNNFLSSWSQIDISYLLVAQNMEGNGISYVWTYSQQVTLGSSSLKTAIVNGQLFNHPNNNNKCGFDGINWNSDGCLAKNAKVLYHVYIMGFQFNPQNYTGKYQLAYEVFLQSSSPSGGFSSNQEESSLNVIYGVSLNGGPVIQINSFSGQLQSIKLVLVMTVAQVMAPNYPIGSFSLTYSGIYFRNLSNPYTSTDLFKIQNNSPIGSNQYYYTLPNIRYVIYGLSRFVANKSSPRSSIIRVVTSLISQNVVSYEQIMMMVDPDIVFSADFYYKRLDTICGTQIGVQSQTQITNIKNITFQSIPTSKDNQIISNVQTGDIPTSSSQLAIQFDISADAQSVGLIRSWTKIVYTQISIGRPYEFQMSFNEIGVNGFITGDSYTAVVKVNGNQIYGDTLVGTSANDAISNIQKGLNIQKDTIQIQLYVTAFRSAANDIHFRFSILVLQFQLVFDPVSQCCVDKCPINSGLNVIQTPVSCISCDSQQGLFYDSQTQNCACISGYYYEPDIIQKCFQCQTEYCKICNPSEPSKCVQCVIYAELSQTFKTCQCSTGFYPVNGQCLPCGPQCKSCSSAYACDSCVDQLHRDSKNNCSCIRSFYDMRSSYCSACNPSCATCNNSLSCLSCNYIDNRVLFGTICKCMDGYFELIDSNMTRTCVKCDDTCLTCSLSASSCIDCSLQKNRQKVLIPNTVGVYQCLCKSGYHALQNGVCIQSDCTKDVNCAECYSELKQCTQCIANRNRVLKIPEGICLCQTGYFQNQKGNCQICTPGCADCKNATICNSCSFLAVKNSIGGCTCPNTTFFTVSQGVGYCSNCIKNCQACSDGTTCITCSNTFTLTIDKQCVCSSARYVDTNGSCQSCGQACQACSNQTNCLKCVPPLVLDFGVCASSCRVGFYQSQYTCLACPSGCLNCSAPSLCSLCDSQYLIFNGICYKNCPSGTVENINSLVCVPCNRPCQTCSNHPSHCTSCELGGGYLQNYNQTQICVQQCSPGTFANNGVCSICDFRCSTCLSSAKNCISCLYNQYLYSGGCYAHCPGILLNDLCINQCPDGYYKTSNSVCSACRQECLTCNSNTSCLTCKNSLLSNNGICVNSCDLGFFAFAGYCLSCSSICKSCQSNPLNCTSCQNGYNLIKNRCYLSCQFSQYLDVSLNLCIACPNECLSCQNQNFCVTCINQVVVVNGSCNICAYPCQTCVSHSTSLCSKCFSGFYLFDSRCVTFCPAGATLANLFQCKCSNNNILLNGQCIDSCPQYYAKVDSSCLKCPNNCIKCSINIQICEQCQGGYILNSNNSQCQYNVIPQSKSQSQCPLGQKLNSKNTCQPICSNNYNFLQIIGNNDQTSQLCIYGQCIQGYYLNGIRSCVKSSSQISSPTSPNTNTNNSSANLNKLSCLFPYFLQSGNCQPLCNIGYFGNTKTRSCQICGQNCVYCTDSAQCEICQKGFIIIQGICILVKCQPAQILYMNSCLSSCPSGTYPQNKVCVRICPSGTYNFGMFCYNKCPIQAVYRTNDACVNVCPNGIADQGSMICNN